MQVLASGQLRIIHASPEDAGNYFCIAQNSVGSAVGKTRLVVQGGPQRARSSEAPESHSLLWLALVPGRHIPASSPTPAWLAL